MVRHAHLIGAFGSAYLALLAVQTLNGYRAYAQVVNISTITGSAGAAGTSGANGNRGSDGAPGPYVWSRYVQSDDGRGGDGGTGGSGVSGGDGGSGGVGQLGTNTEITNSGTISGGIGGHGGSGGSGGEGGRGGDGGHIQQDYCSGYEFEICMPMYFGQGPGGNGGQGGSGAPGGDGGDGGPAVSGSGLVINNTGSITGGQGGSGGDSGSSGYGGPGGHGMPPGQWAYNYGGMFDYFNFFSRGGNGGAGITLNGGTNTIINGTNALIQGGSYGNNTGFMPSQAPSGDGINLSGGTTAITNLGTIVGGPDGSWPTYGIRLTGSASISTLTNLQGGNSPLTYYGALPSTYNVVVRSSTNFGKLEVDWSSGSLTFGVDSTSILGANRYVNVLKGIGASAIANEGTEFTLGSFVWSLIAGSTANNWDLEVSLLPGIGVGTSVDIANSSTTSFVGGTILVSSSGEYGQNWSLGNQSTNTINLAGNNSVFSGSFSDLVSGQPGNIVFSNQGSVVLTAISTYTGSTTVVNGSTLSVNGSIASSSGLTVNSGGTIGGTGSLPQTNLVSGAMIAPGNSIGTVTVAGLSLNGGTFDAEIQGPQNDKVSVTGNVTNFTGTANLIPFGGGSPWPNFDYQLITASNNFANSSSLTLDQSGVTSALLNYGTNLVQEADGNATTFDVQWQPKNGSGATASAISSLGKGQRNQLATAGAFDSVFSSLATAAGNQSGTTTGLNATGTAIGTTGFTTGQAAAAGISSDFLTATSQLLALTSGSQLTAAIDSLSPEPYAAYQAVGLSTLKRQRDLLFSQAGNCQSNGWIINAPETKKGKTPKRPVCVFAQANNATSSIRGQDGLSSYNSGVFSSFYGLEYQPSKQWSVGAAYGYGTSNLSNMSLTSANVSSDVNGGALYAVYKPAERWNIKALLGYSNFDVDGSRNVAYIGNGSTINGNTSANGYTAAINASYEIPIKVGKGKLPMLLKPIAGLAWGGYQQSGFTESDGGALNLRVNGNTANSLVGTLGMEFASSPIALSKNKVQSITPRLAVAYQVDALANSSGNKSLTSSFVDAPGAGSFSTQGENGGTNAFTVAGGFDLQVAKNASLYATVSYEVESNGSQFGYGGGLRVSF